MLKAIEVNRPYLVGTPRCGVRGYRNAMCFWERLVFVNLGLLGFDELGAIDRKRLIEDTRQFLG
jgi:hypothetical protein